MKRMMIIFILVIGFCFGLFAQPRPFDPDYYKDSLRVKKSDEFKKLEEYRDLYKKKGLPLTGTGYAYGYPTFYSDLFFHKRINLNKLEEYRKIGFFNGDTASEIMNDIYNPIFRPVIIIGELITFNRGRYDDISFYKVKHIISGRELYNSFPNTIKCYSSAQGFFIAHDNNYKEVPTFFGKINPKQGDEFILFLYAANQVEKKQLNRNPDDFNKSNVFYSMEAKYISEHKSAYVEEVMHKINIINSLRAEK